MILMSGINTKMKPKNQTTISLTMTSQMNQILTLQQ
jgi:hypothetical protein